MTLFTLTVGKRPILVFEAEDDIDADDIAKAGWLRDDLRVLESEGRPLWDGRARIRVREASDAEREIYRARCAAAVEDGDGDTGMIIYLVPVSDPTDDGTGDEAWDPDGSP